MGMTSEYRIMGLNACVQPQSMRPERIDRIVRAAARAYEDRFCETIRDLMMPRACCKLIWT